MGTRITKAIDFAAAQNFLEAVRFAEAIGLALNLFVTIHWVFAPGEARAQRRQARMLERASKWLARRKIRFACVWVMERIKTPEPHGHLLIHVPDAHLDAFRKKLPDWIGTARIPGLVRSPRVYDDGRRLRAYLLKGVEPAAAVALGIVASPQGAIEGKRIGTSESIGRANRERHAALQVEREAA